MKYTGNSTKEILFPLGGIGTGSIGLTGNGSFMDWEIFNRPQKGSVNGYSHIAVKAIKDDKPITYVLNGDLLKDFMGQYGQTDWHCYGFGPSRERMGSFPHFKDVEFNGEFPIATLDFKDEFFPADVTLRAFNPFIPGDSDNSSIPAAFFEIEIKNTTADKIKYQVALTLANPYVVSRNVSSKENGISHIKLLNAGADKDDIEYGDLTIATDCENAIAQTYWYRGGWSDGIITYWTELDSVEPMKDRQYDTDGKKDTATLVAEIEVMPNTSGRVRFVMSWNVPNNNDYWNNDEHCGIWKNYYATLFSDSYESAKYSLDNWDMLYERTKLFKDALHGATLPDEVIDAAASNLSVLKSPTVLRLTDGSFYGWEGVHESVGSCEGTCQHVWNYAYAMCFLFPDLERSIRDLEFKYSTDENGRMGFRLMLPIGRKMTDFRACVDGQMGAVIKCYREWKISGDNEWLKANWDNIKKVLEYAWSEHNEDEWDRDHDGILEGRQHHTLDMELFGPSSWLEGMYLLALRAAAEMAEFLGDTEKAEEYRELFNNGYEWTKDNLYNGKYFIQKVDFCDKSVIDHYGADNYWNDEVGEIKYQIGEGSSIDQMLAQWHADILGLGRIFDSEQTQNALDEMMKNNFRESMRYVLNTWRVFAINDESATVICSFPEGVKKPRIAVPYYDEAMTGFEYSFAGLLCSQGRISDGLKVVKAVRDRFDGEKRNPWNEFECGSNYARSMASYALIPILSGFEFDMPNAHIGFNPYKTDNFRCVWSLCGGWGEIIFTPDKIHLTLNEGEISLKSFGCKAIENVKSVRLDGKEVDFKLENGIITFDETKISKGVEIIL